MAVKPIDLLDINEGGPPPLANAVLVLAILGHNGDVVPVGCESVRPVVHH